MTASQPFVNVGSDGGHYPKARREASQQQQQRQKKNALQPI